MHDALLFVHSYLRWLVLGLLLAALLFGARGWMGARPWSKRDQRLGLILVAALDLQLLLGLIVYMLSPIIATALGDMGAAMRTSAIRFWFVEHLLLMLAAISAAHVTWVLVKRAADDLHRHRRTTIGFGVTLLLLLAAIPWPFLSYGRPLLRGITG